MPLRKMSKGKHFDFEDILFSCLHFSFLVQFKLNLQVVFMSLGRVKNQPNKTCCPYCSLQESEISKFPRAELWIPLGSTFSILWFNKIRFPQQRWAREAEPRGTAGSQLCLFKTQVDAETWVLLTETSCTTWAQSQFLSHTHPGKFSVLFQLFGCLEHPKKRHKGSSQTALRWCFAPVQIDRHC